MITIEKLKQKLKYDSETGIFTWLLTPPRSKAKIGDVAGCITNNRVQITIEGERYYGHQLAWFYTTGEFPAYFIRHLDGNQRNNRFSNLVQDTDVKAPLTQELLRNLFTYYEESGVLTRKVGSGSFEAGSIAGHIHKKSGYVRVIINNKSYAAHRLIWLYMTGILLEETSHIDHINGDKADNRWINLRLASRSENNSNVGLRKDNTSGIKGLRFAETFIECRVAFKRKTYYKCFKLDQLEDAKQWLRETRSSTQGEFSNNG